VRPDVTCHVVHLFEQFAADGTLVRPLSGVHSHVSLHVLSAAESLIAQRAPVSLVSAVNGAVLNQFRRRLESFAADTARKQLLVRVTQNVHFQHLTVLKAFSALKTLIFTTVHVQVLLQAALG